MASMTAGMAAPNYDESKVPPYTLPDPLVCADGTKVADAATWREKRRPELLRLFEEHVYGRPKLDRPAGMKVQIVNDKPDARDGRARRRQIALLFDGTESGPRMDILLYRPAAASGPVPVFLGLNFNGNHTVTRETDVPLPRGWVPNVPTAGVTDNRASEQSRGSAASRWDIDYALERGYAVATAYTGDIDPDFDDGFRNGVHVLGRPEEPGDWGSIGTWAWGLSRALDALESEPGIDAKRVIVMGHSRLGKTALWAGARDERFAAVISNNSGAGGAALSRRIFGETVRDLNSRFPHWFCKNFARYNDREAECPVDQHELLALIAPRPVLVASATEDTWADPKGEFLSALGASPVYRLLGTSGLEATTHPAPGEFSGGVVSYYLRTGKHDVTAEDWRNFVRFADAHVRGKSKP